MSLQQIVEILPRYTYRYANEAELHEGIGKVLHEHGVAYVREFVAGPQDRFDFLVAPGIVIEVKIKGSLAEALIQVRRYAQRVDVSAVVLVTTRFWGRAYEITDFNGKPIRMVHLRGAAF